MFLINIKAKIFHIIGIVIVAIMFMVSISLIVFSAFFRSGDGESSSAELFGYNLYVVKSSAFEEIPKDSIAVSQKVNASELSPEYLIVFNEFNSEKRILGKVNEVFISDGVYSCDVTDENAKIVTVSESQLVGKVVYYSQVFGDIIIFARSPFGILILAVLPCLAIILLDFIKLIASRLPPPEVIPVKKNEETDPEVKSSTTIKVDDNGNARYTSAGKSLSPESAQDILFTRNKVYSRTNETKAPAAKPVVKHEESAPVKQSVSTQQKRNIEAAPQAVRNAYKSAAASSAVKPSKPQITTEEADFKATVPEKKTTPESGGFFTSRKTSEPPVLKKPSETKPKSETKPIEKARNLADLEESLIYTHPKNKTEPKVRASDVIAGMKPDTLLKDDDDAIDKKRYSVDDILAGLEKK